MQRRDFLKAGLAAGATARAQRGPATVELPSSDPLSAAPPVRWAAGELRRALDEAKIGARIVARSIKGAPESLGIAPSGSAITTSGADARGLAYALLELADRARHGVDLAPQPLSESPLNPVRSVSRMFVSDVEDKPWFNDRAMWPEYLTMLATQRFNRFSLALSIGYDFLREVTDAYFLFPYPFLLAVPGFNVRATNIPDAERDRNLETLRFISEQTVARGLDFQLGLWMHGYVWANSPNANHVIEGLTPETHAPYCRAALTALLKSCPAISGVTFRIHGESGVAEGSYAFWKEIFGAVRDCGRRVGLDLHSKGIDQQMIDTALATGLPVTVSPKFWAEHEGMPYHQADIRDQEVPHGHTATGLMALSAGSRSFTRYGVADLLREDRRYGIVHRIWPGSQRMLLWGDPEWTAQYSRAFTFCGSKGVEMFEPLSFKGRRGSGHPGGRCGYADASLNPRWDWQKFLYTYRVWGRLLYNPETDPAAFERELSGPPAAALAHASRILPIITTSHLPSAANNNYWPEMYFNQPIVDARKNRYSDTPAPKVFGNVSPLDPQLFYRINDFADDLLKGERSGKYSPVEVALWLEGLAGKSTVMAGRDTAPALRRLAIDTGVEAGTGAFFAAKFRAAVLYRMHDRTGDRRALEEAIRLYRAARAAWVNIAEATKGVYVADLTVGELPWLRGNWADRLPAIDDDIADMEKRLASAKESDDASVAQAILRALGGSDRPSFRVIHEPVARFRPKKPIGLEFKTLIPLTAARLHYRRVNQAERWESVDIAGAGQLFSTEIPAAYTDTDFPLQYYFELKTAPDKAALHPGLPPNLAGQPYYVIRKG